MSRALTAVAGLLIVIAAAAAVFLWWTAAPSADEQTLLAALSLAPAADGRIAIAQPRRAARWLVRHPQALALLAVAAPEARAALPRLQPLLRALLDGADGPAIAWWRGKEAAVAARLRPGAVQAVTLLAARAGLAWDVADDVARIATDGALLAPGLAAAPAAAGNAGLAAIMELHGRPWRVTAGRDRLTVASGAPVELPGVGGPSYAATRDAAALLQPLGLPLGAEPHAARVVFAASGGWGATAAGVRLPSFAGGAKDEREQQNAGGEPHRWSGFLGDVWVLDDGTRVAIATDTSLLAQVAAPAPEQEEGRVSGRDVAWLATELATTLGQLPLLDREARALRQAGAFAAGIATARWRFDAAGAAVEIGW